MDRNKQSKKIKPSDFDRTGDQFTLGSKKFLFVSGSDKKSITRGYVEVFKSGKISKTNNLFTRKEVNRGDRYSDVVFNISADQKKLLAYTTFVEKDGDELILEYLVMTQDEKILFKETKVLTFDKEVSVGIIKSAVKNDGTVMFFIRETETLSRKERRKGVEADVERFGLIGTSELEEFEWDGVGLGASFFNETEDGNFAVCGRVSEGDDTKFVTRLFDVKDRSFEDIEEFILT